MCACPIPKRDCQQNRWWLLGHWELSEGKLQGEVLWLGVSASCSAGVREATGQLAVQSPGMGQSAVTGFLVPQQ